MSGWTVLVVDDNVAERVLADQPGLPIVLFTAVLDDATQQAADGSASPRASRRTICSSFRTP